MATPLKSLMSLPSHGTVKHVVPWKNRKEFQSVYDDLFHEDQNRQHQAIDRIGTWKSRVGAKLSVAIESSASLQQVLLDYSEAKTNDLLRAKDDQLKASSSLAIIRFVNHVTEKAQTKSTAQPVHLIAREFGIPEWIVRLRHDATHGALPCLDVLLTGVRWSLDYLKVQFWQQQMNDQQQTDFLDKEKPKKSNLSKIRAAIYDFQKARYQELNDDNPDESKESNEDHSETLQILQFHLNQNRLQFIQCFLEDGILVSTEEQLAVFGVKAEDLLDHSPPTVPAEISTFWSPLIRKLYSCGVFPLLMHTALVSITPESNLRNYQLVAWLLYLLAQSSDPSLRGKRGKRKKKLDIQIHVPKKSLLPACLQNITPYTVHLLKHLADRESLGDEVYDKLTKLLHINTQAASADTDDEESGSDSDTIYTVEDLKREKLEKLSKKSSEEEYASVEDVENSLEKSGIPWTVCTDIVDWSTVPFGVLPCQLPPDSLDEEEDEEEDNIEMKDEHESQKNGNSSEDVEYDSADNATPKKKRHRHKEDDSGSDCISPKRSSYTPTVEVL